MKIVKKLIREYNKDLDFNLFINFLIDLFFALVMLSGSLYFVYYVMFKTAGKI